VVILLLETLQLSPCGQGLGPAGAWFIFASAPASCLEAAQPLGVQSKQINFRFQPSKGAWHQAGNLICSAQGTEACGSLRSLPQTSVQRVAFPIATFYINVAVVGTCIALFPAVYVVAYLGAQWAACQQHAHCNDMQQNRLLQHPFHFNKYMWSFRPAKPDPKLSIQDWAGCHEHCLMVTWAVA
jgi:hypothetical protein